MRRIILFLLVFGILNFAYTINVVDKFIDVNKHESIVFNLTDNNYYAYQLRVKLIKENYTINLFSELIYVVPRVEKEVEIDSSLLGNVPSGLYKLVVENSRGDIFEKELYVKSKVKSFPYVEYDSEGLKVSYSQPFKVDLVRKYEDGAVKSNTFISKNVNGNEWIVKIGKDRLNEDGSSLYLEFGGALKGIKYNLVANEKGIVSYFFLKDEKSYFKLAGLDENAEYLLFVNGANVPIKSQTPLDGPSKITLKRSGGILLTYNYDPSKFVFNKKLNLTLISSNPYIIKLSCSMENVPCHYDGVLSFKGNNFTSYIPVHFDGEYSMKLPISANGNYVVELENLSLSFKAVDFSSSGEPLTSDTNDSNIKTDDLILFLTPLIILAIVVVVLFWRRYF